MKNITSKKKRKYLKIFERIFRITLIVIIYTFKQIIKCFLKIFFNFAIGKYEFVKINISF